MFVLVTQADGSARRFTWVTYAIVACFMALFALQHAAGDGAANGRGEALAYLNENPYVEVGERFRHVIPLDYAQALRETFFQERRERGLALMSDHLVRRGQDEFDKLLESALVETQALPVWKYGVTGVDTPIGNWLAHATVHTTQFALVVSVLLLLCLGIAIEDGWGSILFACFALVAVVSTGLTSVGVHYYDVMGAPWFGASGLVAALLGAYFVRSLHGSPRLLGAVPMPGWLLLPIWVACEYVAIRGVSSSAEIAEAPAIVHGAGLGLGVAVGAAMRLLRVESKMLNKAHEAVEIVSNRALERAMLARQAGQTKQAFELLRKEFRRSPKNRDVALALWDVSLQLGKASSGVESILSVVESDLHAGQPGQAVTAWCALTDEVEVPPARPPLLVRIGEALLDKGHPEAAIAALTQAVDGTTPLTGALAQRVVRIARDLDPELTRRAAEIALQDDEMGTAEREDLSKLSSTVLPGPASNSPRAQAAGQPQSDPETVPDHAGLPEFDTPLATPEEAGDTNVELADSAERHSPGLEDADVSALDPQALSLDDLQEGLGDDLYEFEAEESWSDSGLTAQTAVGRGDDLEDALDELDGLGDSTLSVTVTGAASIGDTVTEVNVSSSIPGPEEAATEALVPSGGGEETTTVVNIVPPARSLRVREAVPVALESKAIVIEVDGGSKTRLPYARIEALAAAAVQGLGEKPVVVIDLAVNWRSASEPLKVIRLRSDRFDPAQLVPGSANQLEALRKLLADLIGASDGTPLPSFGAATGAPFRVFDALVDYERDVLEASDDAR